MFRVFQIPLGQRAVVLRHGIPQRALGPGRHRIWGFGLELIRFATDSLVFDAPAELRAVLPEHWFDEAPIGDEERGILLHQGVPKVFLRPGVHHFWTIDESVRLRVVRVDEPVPELTDELLDVIPGRELLLANVGPHDKGLLYVKGRLQSVLDPGRFAFWQSPDRRVEVKTVDMRSTELAIAGQEIMTRDKVTLRLNLAVDFAIVDPIVAMHTVENVRTAIYTTVQLAARDFVAGVTLDELLEGRDAMTQFLADHANARAAELGVRFGRVGVKDVVLPGEMKALLNRVIAAEKEAQANVILRREETNATRSLANTAKVMAENPTLLRLKELEAIKDIAGQIGDVHLVLGAEGLDKLGTLGLLGPRNGR